MKKLVICGLCITFLFSVTACSKSGAGFNLSNSNSSIQNENYSANESTIMHEISYADYEEKMNNHESYILYIGSTYCSHCKEFKPTLEKVIKDYDLEVFYLDVSKLSDEESDDIWSTSKIGGTPSIVYVTDGNIKLFPRIEGTVSEDVLVAKLTSAGYIK